MTKRAIRCIHCDQRLDNGSKYALATGIRTSGTDYRACPARPGARCEARKRVKGKRQ